MTSHAEVMKMCAFVIWTQVNWLKQKVEGTMMHPYLKEVKGIIQVWLNMDLLSLDRDEKAVACS